MDIPGYPWISIGKGRGGGWGVFFLKHLLVIGGNFQGNLGELRGQSKIILRTIPDGISKFVFIVGRSEIDLGAIWHHPGQRFVKLHYQKHHPSNKSFVNRPPEIITLFNHHAIP